MLRILSRAIQGYDKVRELVKGKCADCKKEYKWTVKSPNYCPRCRRKHAKPIETICASCGESAHGLYCDACSRVLV